MKIGIIGCGAAGMAAAYAAGKSGADVTVFDGNEKAGKKLYITGKGRCNITNACDIEDFFANIPTNPKFLYSALYTLTNDALVALLNENGLKTKVERGGRVFPESDKSSDVIATLVKMVRKAGTKIRLNDKVRSLIIEEGRVKGLVSESGRHLFDSVIICTGGLSYPLTGSTGDGYGFAQEAGHTVTPLEPSLVALAVRERELIAPAQGLSLKNVRLTLSSGAKRLYEEQGEMLLTHFGVSGPLVLSASAHLNVKNTEGAQLSIDFKPALSPEKLDKRIVRDFGEAQNRQLKNVLTALVPKSFVPVLLEYCSLAGELFVHDVTKEQRERLVSALKGFRLTVHSKRSLKEAIVTRGGVNVKEVDPATMRSRLIGGLYFAGEVLDLDGYTGGFNLQIAFSTGYLAGLSSVQN